MAQYEVAGGGTIYSGNQQIDRKVVVSTDGSVSAPSVRGLLSNITITKEAGGITRGVFEGITTVEASEYSGYNHYGKKIELMGGSREVPIQAHPYFQGMSEQEIAQVETQIDNKKDDVWWTKTKDGNSFTDKQQILYNFLRRQIDYALVPSIVGRVTEIETNLPSLADVAKVANPSELIAPNGTFWICTAVNAVALGNSFEVTREYTLNVATWDDVQTLYGWGGG